MYSPYLFGSVSLSLCLSLSLSLCMTHMSNFLTLSGILLYSGKFRISSKVNAYMYSPHLFFSVSVYLSSFSKVDAMHRCLSTWSVSLSLYSCHLFLFFSVSVSMSVYLSLSQYLCLFIYVCRSVSVCLSLSFSFLSHSSPLLP